MRKFAPLFAATVMLASAGAYAQSSPPAPSTGGGQPTSGKPATPPVPAAPDQRKAIAAPAVQSLVGKHAFSSDGSRVGDVQAVKTAPDGRVTALLLKTGGFLGFGGRMVEIPEGRFTPSNQDVRLDMTADEASKLPEAKDGT